MSDSRKPRDFDLGPQEYHKTNLGDFDQRAHQELNQDSKTLESNLFINLNASKNKATLSLLDFLLSLAVIIVLFISFSLRYEMRKIREENKTIKSLLGPVIK